MSILFSGDLHASFRNELKYISKREILNLYQKELYDSIQYHIILGDTGLGRPWNNNADKEIYKALNHRPFPILCVVGDDDPLYEMQKYEEVDIGIGEKVLKIHEKPFIAYLVKGKVYYIEGIKFLVLGGAKSYQNNSHGKNNSFNAEKSYWSEKEKNDLYLLLENNSTFDLVLSHTGSNFSNSWCFGRKRNLKVDLYDEVSYLNHEIEKRIRTREWFCGHFHYDAFFFDEETDIGYEYFYRRSLLLSKESNKIVQYFVDVVEIDFQDFGSKHTDKSPYMNKEITKYIFNHEEDL